MAQNITISRTAGIRALLTALFAVVVLLVNRMVNNALEGLKLSRQWLQAKHSFFAQDGDPIRCTGYQIVGYNLAAAAAALLLCINF